VKQQSLFVTFCNQSASPRESGGFLSLDDDGFAWLALARTGILEPGSNGLCGACLVDGELILATQSAPPLLLLYDPVAGRITAQRDLSPCVDLHSIVFHAGSLLVASTGTNEIYAVPFSDHGFGEPRPYWRYPGVDYDRDLVHLNGLTLAPEGLIASCFGPRQPDGAWGSAGSVFLVEPHEVIQDGLCQPHTPLYAEERLFFAESRGHRVHELQRDPQRRWRAQAAMEVGDYVRGLALQGDRLWIGLSAPRRISRSKGTPNRGIDTTLGSAVGCIDLATRTMIERRALGGLGDEIYDLLILAVDAPPGGRVEALTQRIGSMQAMCDDSIETRRKLGEMMAEKAYAEQILQSLQAEQAYTVKVMQALQEQQLYAAQLKQALQLEQIFATKLSNELRTVTGSRLWRAAQWVRRLAGRAPHAPDLGHPPMPDPGPPPVPDLVRTPAADPGHASASVPGQPPLPAQTSPARPMAEVFNEIYVTNHWGSEVSHSGGGSDLQQTTVIRETLPALLRELGVQSMLDVPCGDFHWMRTLELGVDYTGADVVAALIAENTAAYTNERRRFALLDIANDTLPRVDLVFCRDLLVHFSFADALRALANLKRSGSTWLLTTTFTNRTNNVDITTGEWRPINLQLPPFDFPPPQRMINENCTEFGTDWADKSLGLWRLVDL